MPITASTIPPKNAVAIVVWTVRKTSCRDLAPIYRAVSTLAPTDNPRKMLRSILHSAPQDPTAAIASCGA